jgi:hypothetical protein
MPAAGTRAAREAGLLQLAAAVLCAFVGIRERAAHERDARAITPVQAIVTGLVAAAILVLGLIGLVRFITG